MSRFFPNLYLVNHTRRFKAVCVSKNACTTLKWITLLDDYPQLAKSLADKHTDHIHDAFGYRANGSNLIELSDLRWPDYMRFAVYRASDTSTTLKRGRSTRTTCWALRPERRYPAWRVACMLDRNRLSGLILTPGW